MRKSSFISVLVALLVVAAVVVWHFVPRQLPYSECGDIYKHYAAEKGVEATYIKDYKVNDTVFVDVTLLEATDSVGWATLKKDFEVLDPSLELQQLIDNGKDLVYLKLIPKASTVGPSPNTYPNDLLAVSHVNRTLNVFHVRNRTEDLAVRHYNYDKSTNQ